MAPRSATHATLPRGRVRVTNKTRLKIVRGAIDADPIVLDEEEEKARASQLVAGVDLDDANEHHLQAVLNASGRTDTGPERPAADGSKSAAAFIPVPNATGVIENYDELYPPAQWNDPESYLRASDSVDEAVSAALNDGFTYYMDEQDKEWLDRNNEEARGEGTSAQGSVTSSGGTRSSQRSAKAKGKDPECMAPVTITEDEFELIMGVFEKATHDKTEFLHHGLKNGMAFPPFTDYQDIFSIEFPASMFATYVPPTWIPKPPQLLRMARTVYPHWRERRLAREGHRIIPTLNFDETDVSNESYICFRRREAKAIRKTRASQISYSDRLIRLQNELRAPAELAQDLVLRERIRKDVQAYSQRVWNSRYTLVELRRQFGAMIGGPGDEELLVDKERISKKSLEATKRSKPKLADTGKTGSPAPHSYRRSKPKLADTGKTGSPAPRPEPQMRPRERLAAIQSAIDRELQARKEQDHHWEDQIDNAYQPRPVPYAQRCFKWVPSATMPLPVSSLFAAASDNDDEVKEPPAKKPRLEARPARSIRIRLGRAGRTWVDRRAALSLSNDDHTDDDASDADITHQHSVTDRGEASSQQSALEVEDERRVMERWMFDADDCPPYGPGINAADEEARELVDDYHEKYLLHSMRLLTESDYASMTTDVSIQITGADGRMQTIAPIRPIQFARPHPQTARPHTNEQMQQLHRMHLSRQQLEAQSHQLQLQPSSVSAGQPPVSSHGSMPSPVMLQNGPSISVMMKKAQQQHPPNGLAQMRISGVRSQSQSWNNAASPASSAIHGSPPQMPVAPLTSPRTHPATAIDNTQGQVTQHSPSHPALPLAGAQSDSALTASPVNSHSSPLRSPAKPIQNHPIAPHAGQPTQVPVSLPNGYHVPAMNGYSAATYIQNSSNGQAHVNGYNMPSYKSAFAQQQYSGTNTAADLSNGLRGLPAAYVQQMVVANGASNGTNFNLPATPINLKLPVQRQMQWAAAAQTQRPHTADVSVNMVNSPSPRLVPARTPSRSSNGINMSNGAPNMVNGMSMSPLPQHSPTPMHASPPRTMPSPSLHQQPVGGPQRTY